MSRLRSQQECKGPQELFGKILLHLLKLVQVATEGERLTFWTDLASDKNHHQLTVLQIALDDTCSSLGIRAPTVVFPALLCIAVEFSIRI